MTAARRRGSAAQQILVFGEDENDRKSVTGLVAGLRPDLARELEPTRSPITLVRDMRPENARRRNDRIRATIRAANARRTVRATLLHEDADDVEPAHVALIDAKEGSLATAPGEVVAVVPAWEMETWLLLFPDAIQAYRPTWRRPDDYVGRDVGMVRKSKEELKRKVRPSAKGRGVVDYHENDAPAIVEVIVRGGHLRSPMSRSASWSHFVGRIRAL